MSERALFLIPFAYLSFILSGAVSSCKSLAWLMVRVNMHFNGGWLGTVSLFLDSGVQGLVAIGGIGLDYGLYEELCFVISV
jgi:hypothetical protein